MPLIFFSFSSISQVRLKVPVSINIEDGDFEGVTIVITNKTTNESNSIAGASKNDIELKINSDYVLSFTKPGYISKKMAINTNAPADRAAQGFYPYDFVINLFPQYDGVNIVVFNQPVGKVFYNRLIDDFDYDTDYTKQIQSALKAAEEEVLKRQKEEKGINAKKKKDAEKAKNDSLIQAKADAKLKLEADRKSAEEAKIEVARLAKQNQAQEEQRKLESKANQDEEKRKVAIAKIEEEERTKAKAAEEEEKRISAINGGGNDKIQTGRTANSGSEKRPNPSNGSGNDSPSSSLKSGQGSDTLSKSLGSGGGKEDLPIVNQIQKKEIKNQSTINSTSGGGSEDKPSASISKTDSKKPEQIIQEKYEEMPDITVQEISEMNRNITRVTVRKGEKETIYSKIIYTWGGIYYFRNTMSISESLFSSSTGRK